MHMSPLHGDPGLSPLRLDLPHGFFRPQDTKRLGSPSQKCGLSGLTLTSCVREGGVCQRDCWPGQ